MTCVGPHPQRDALRAVALARTQDRPSLTDDLLSPPALAAALLPFPPVLPVLPFTRGGARPGSGPAANPR